MLGSTNVQLHDALAPIADHRRRVIILGSQRNERRATIANWSAIDFQQHVARTQTTPAVVRLEHEEAALTATAQVRGEIVVHTSEAKALERERRVVAVVHRDAVGRRSRRRGVHGRLGARPVSYTHLTLPTSDLV